VTRSSLIAFAGGFLLASRRRDRAPQRERTVTLRGRPDSRRRPSDGVVAEASIVARLLRLRLLRLDATVVVSPAVVTARSSRPGAAAQPARDGPVRTREAPVPARPIGRRLAEAARTLDENAAALAATRREVKSLP
jgi:hypothetical protein